MTIVKYQQFTHFRLSEFTCVKINRIHLTVICTGYNNRRDLAQETDHDQHAVSADTGRNLCPGCRLGWLSCSADVMLHILCHFFGDFNCVLFLQNINSLKANKKYHCA
jgi:hypothetical protein